MSFDIPAPIVGKRGAVKKAHRASLAAQEVADETGTQDRKPVEAYISTAGPPGTGPGGWAVVLLYDDESRQFLSGGAPLATSNKMALEAVAACLRLLKHSAQLTIHCPAEYVTNGLNVNRASWEAAGWRTAAKQPVKNLDLWMALYAEHDLRPGIEVKWFHRDRRIKRFKAADDLARKVATEQRQARLQTA